MKNFLIVARTTEPPYDGFVSEIVTYLEKNGAATKVVVNPRDDTKPSEIVISPEVECIITVGGDGTLIRAAQNASKYPIPMVGVNYGHLGYLCDINKENLAQGLDKLLADAYTTEDRMMLTGFIKKADGSGESASPNALNDIVVRASVGGLSVINLTVYVNGSYLYSYNCDGLIFSTPTGSTAYNLSANGPIVNPEAQCIVLTPINPHTLNSRSIVLGDTEKIEVVLGTRREDIEEVAEVSFDGNHKQILHVGEPLCIYKAQETTKMIRLENSSFLERIRSRMQEM